MSLQLGAEPRGLKPYRYDPQGLARVASALPARAAPTARWPSIALLAAFLGIFCRAHAPGGSASAADHLTPADRSSEMIVRHAGVVAAMVLASSATAQDAVQWRVQDGGNGHWYRVVADIPNLVWSEANGIATTAGGHLVTFGSVTEIAFAVGLVNQSSATLSPLGPWIGLVQDQSASGYAEPAGGWRWIDNTDAAVNWQAPLNPNNDCFGVAEDYANMTFDGQVNDLAADPSCTGYWPNGAINSLIIEWSADCNSDGIVDFGQIRAGELEDVNANNIPDCCESGGNCDPCPADVIEDGVVNGVDLAAVINAWGTAGGKLPRADVDGSGVVDASDLAAVLGSWGPCQP